MSNAWLTVLSLLWAATSPATSSLDAWVLPETRLDDAPGLLAARQDDDGDDEDDGADDEAEPDERDGEDDSVEADDDGDDGDDGDEAVPGDEEDEEDEESEARDDDSEEGLDEEDESSQRAKASRAKKTADKSKKPRKSDNKSKKKKRTKGKKAKVRASSDDVSEAPVKVPAAREGSPPVPNPFAGLLDPSDPRAREGTVVGSRGIDPGWKDSRVAERSPNIHGQTGLRRINSARVGKSGYFDLGLSGRTFYVSDFIAKEVDENTFAGGTGHFGLTIFDVVEIAVATQMASNENSAARPATSFTTGDLIPSVKFGYTALPFAFGLDVRAFLPTSQDQVGVDLVNFGLTATGLFTLDLYEAMDMPLRVHANLGYGYQNAHAVADIRYYANNTAGHLLAMTTGQWYYDQLIYAVGVEAPMPYITPYAEFWGQSPLGVGPTNGPRGGPAGFFDGHLTFTPGARFSVGRGLSFDIALDLGLGGTGGFFEPSEDNLTPGQPVNPPYALQFGVSYTFSPFVAETQVEVRERELPLGQVRGCVVDAESGSRVQEAFVEFTGTAGPRIVVDREGCFISPRLDAGELVVKVKHPEYQPASVTAELTANEVKEVEVALKPAPRYGRLSGVVTNTRDDRVDAVVEITDDEGKRRDYKTREGEFDIELKPGAYQARVRAPDYLQQGAPVAIQPLTRSQQNFILKKLPRKRISVLEGDRIEIATQIPFEYSKARLLRAAEFILDDVVDVILSNPQIRKIRVEGHTDDTGSAATNRRLSESRARAVMDYLVARGVSPERLSAKGFGATRPLAGNDTEEGRARNRRVDFIVKEVEGGAEAPADDDSSAAEEPSEAGDSVEEPEASDEDAVEEPASGKKKKKTRSKRRGRARKRASIDHPPNPLRGSA